jgi:hypothetical protein
MKLPNIKDILKTVLSKLSIFKNNMSLLIPVIIALAGILFFIPTQLLSRSLKNDIGKNSLETGNSLKKIREPVTEDQLKAAQDSLNAAAKDVNNIKLLAMQTTQRELLSYDIFNMDPNDANSTFSQSVFYEFSKLYCDRIDKFISENNARLCLTEAEITEELKGSNILQPGLDAAGRSQDDRGTTAENIQGIMVDQICQKRAKESFVYIDPVQISGYNFWSQFNYSSLQEDVANCWYAQLGYWVIKDIFDTIVAMNAQHKNLLEAPIKRLMKITFSDDLTTTGYASGSTGAGKNAGQSRVYTDRPRYEFSSGDSIKETLTGRYSDGEYDVIRFKVTFVVNTKDSLKLISQLCSAKEHNYIDKSGQSHTYKHNQITVLNVNMKSVEMRGSDHELYRYGKDNVSEMELTCEYVFYVKGYEDIMPQSVKKIFGAVAAK